METNQMNKDAAHDLMRVNFEAIREIQVVKTGKFAVQTTKFHSGWYVPQYKLQEMYESEDPIAAYKEWVLSKAEDEVVNVYDEWVGEPIGTEIVNLAKDHVERFTTWVKCVRADGYEIRLAPIKESTTRQE